MGGGGGGGGGGGDIVVTSLFLLLPCRVFRQIIAVHCSTEVRTICGGVALYWGRTLNMKRGYGVGERFLLGSCWGVLLEWRALMCD